MKKYLLITLSILIVLGVVGYSAYLYQSQRKPAPTISTSQALHQRDEATRLMNLHDAVNKRVQGDLSKQVSDTQAKLVSVCTSLKTTKVVNPNCP